MYPLADELSPKESSTKPIRIIEDDIVKAHWYDVHVIAQQNNCVTKSAKGLAQHIAQTLGVNPYLNSKTRVPGTVDLIMSPQQTLMVANMYAQYHPGGPSSGLRNIPRRDALGLKIEDTSLQRLAWFRLCCQKIRIWMKDNGIETIGLPEGIGCGLARGNWSDYLQIIREELPGAVLFRLNPQF